MAEAFHLPVDFGAILRKGSLRTAPLKTSIREYIFLILLTQRGEWRFDPDFKCLLWEKDFEQTDDLDTWLDEVKDDIRLSVTTYETRLKVQYVDIQKDEMQERNSESNLSRIRNRLTIKVRGKVVQTGDDFDEEFLMFFGPITVV